MPNFVILLEAPQAEAGCCPAAAVMPSRRFVSVSQFYPTASQVLLEPGAGGLPWTSAWQVQVGRNGPHHGTVVCETATMARCAGSSA